MDKRELFKIALRTLATFTQGLLPLQKDVDELRRNAPPQDRHLPTDELACRFVKRGVENGKLERKLP